MARSLLAINGFHKKKLDKKKLQLLREKRSGCSLVCDARASTEWTDIVGLTVGVSMLHAGLQCGAELDGLLADSQAAVAAVSPSWAGPR